MPGCGEMRHDVRVEQPAELRRRDAEDRGRREVGADGHDDGLVAVAKRCSQLARRIIVGNAARHRAQRRTIPALRAQRFEPGSAPGDGHDMPAATQRGAHDSGAGVACRTDDHHRLRGG